MFGFGSGVPIPSVTYPWSPWLKELPGPSPKLPGKLCLFIMLLICSSSFICLKTPGRPYSIML